MITCYLVCKTLVIFFCKGPKGRKQGSPVRIFTNVPLNRLTLPVAEGYRFCRLCDRWTSPENRHCDHCGSCTSKVSSGVLAFDKLCNDLRFWNVPGRAHVCPLSLVRSLRKTHVVTLQQMQPVCVSRSPVRQIPPEIGRSTVPECSRALRFREEEESG
jgi:hypothetical protein